MASTAADDLHPILESEANSLAKLLPVAVHGHESMSRPYRFLVELHDPKAAAPGWSDLASAWLNKKLSIDFGPLDHSKTPNFVDGIVAAVELLGTAKDGADGAAFRIEVVPRLWLLSLTRRTRVFQAMTPLAVVEKVLKEAGITYLSKASAAKTTHSNAQLHVTQYDETDLDFISRLLEDEGVCYWFEHSGSANGATMILANEAGSHPGADKALSMAPGHASLPDPRSVGLRVALVPSSTTVVGYDLNDPLVSRSGSKQIPVGKAPVRHGAWTLSGGPWLGGGKQADAADLLAAVEADRHINRAHTFSGSSSDIRFRAGRRISLPNGDCLITAVEHHWLHPLAGGGKDAYRNTFSWMSWGALPWRPPREAPRPHLDSFITGVVTASAGSQGDSDEATVDGSYRVRLHAAENTERIARLAQPYGGDQRGLHCPLPVDTEVLLAHINGNPDMPVIASVAPNLNAPGPVLEANKTQCALKTGSGHSLVFEDKDKEGSIALTSKAGSKLLIDDKPDKVKVVLSSNSGHGLTLDDTKDACQAKLATKAGHSLLMDDKVGEEQIGLTSKAGQKLLLDDKAGAQKIHLASPDAKQELLIDSTSGAELIKITAAKDLATDSTGKTTFSATDELVISSTKKLTLKVGQASITLDDQGNITLNGMKIEFTAKQDLTGSGLNVELTAQMAAKLSGSASAELSASGQTTVKGAMVMIN